MNNLIFGNSKILKVYSAAVAALLFTGVVCGFPAAENGEKVTSSTAESPGVTDGYTEWLKANGDDVSSVPSFEAAVEKNLAESETVSFSADAPADGLYGLKLIYKTVPGKNRFSSSIELSLSVNGATPYREASQIKLDRCFEREDKPFEKDADGNDCQPELTEICEPMEYTLTDSSGYYAEPLLLRLGKGGNTVTLTARRGSLEIIKAVFGGTEKIPSYSEYSADNGFRENGSLQETVQGEYFYRASDTSAAPATDRSSADISPNSPTEMLLNTLGGSGYSNIGQWVSWKITVPEDGLYGISFRCVQNVNVGAVSGRSLYIDGKIPFKEAETLTFPYSKGYKDYISGSDGRAFRFKLEKGEHILTLKVVPGNMTYALKTVSEVLSVLSEDYLQIIFYTGTDPDIYRNYHLDTLLPDVMADFEECREKLTDVSVYMREISGGRGTTTATPERLADLLKRLTADNDKIPANLSLLNDNISALGTWINTYASQPLAIDSLTVFSGDKLETENGGILKNICFKFKILLSTFSGDYKGDDAQSGESVSVWTSAGRDQSKIITRLAQRAGGSCGFNASVRLVSADAILPNVLSGSKIDVYLNATASDPVNYAIRSAAADLTGFAGYSDVAKSFHPEALVPFTYKGAVYALPTSFDFPVMFYRTDVFEMLGISVPKTWDDFFETAAVLQRNNLTAGITWTDAYNTLLYQSGGNYYNSSLTESMLQSGASQSAFEKTVKLYTDYGLPVDFSFPNRFRNGNMPLGIVSYTMYNQLYLFAPEIDGLWSMAPVPGTVKEDGSIDNTVIGTGGGVVIFKTSKCKEAAWKFVKWWLSNETQVEFDAELEKIMGVSARQTSAVLSVVGQFPWTNEEYAVLSMQWNSIRTVNQLPGSYYTQRMLDFAFNSVYSLGEDAARVLSDNAEELNAEIARKSKEFEGGENRR